ncbi:hypothetical protein [Mycolicibacterium sediminis]|uniref:Transport accessory protein MmpS3 n=1 Tax=Mycolicibacterium sediminis TaxID=1286180 RepID=A0A7I7QRX2_9MYCO|nr:hypothetical protein [Mycolicibacterium sediminis]BBY28707.1 hypothetical protein MSEDJ_28030 [Mycolicibacterium sediminis]
MSRDYRPYSSTSSRPQRAESWQPDRPYGGGRGDRGGDYGDLGDYGDHRGGSEHDTSRARRYAGSYAAGRSGHQVLDDEPRYPYRHATADRDRYDARDATRDDAVDYPMADDEGDDEIYEYYEPIDRRWVWVAGVAAAILLVAVLCTVVILGGGDSGSVSATVNPPLTSEPSATRTAPPTVRSTPAPPVASLPPETVTTVAPTPSASVAPPPVAAVPVPPAAAANTVTYTVSGTRALIDLVTVIYTDAQGALQTDLNVALPWRKTVVLDPGVTLSSVTATSVTGQLNCSITDAAGVALAAQNGNSIITTCTR